MKIADIKSKNLQEIRDQIVVAKAELSAAVIESRTKEVRDTKKLGRLKKTIAQLLTIEHDRSNASQEQAK